MSGKLELNIYRYDDLVDDAKYYANAFIVLEDPDIEVKDIWFTVDGKPIDDDIIQLSNILQEEKSKDIVLSDPLCKLLYNLKNDTSETSYRVTGKWESAAAYIEEFYVVNFKVSTFLKVLIQYYLEASEVKEFEFSYGTSKDALLQRLLIKPYDKMSFDEFMNSLNSQKHNNLDAIYSVIIECMLSDLMLTRVDWCSDQLKKFKPKEEE